MRLIEQYGNIVQAEDAAEKLRVLGILTHISSKNSYRISRASTGAFKVGLWAVLEFQYKDACSVLIKVGFSVAIVIGILLYAYSKIA